MVGLEKTIRKALASASVREGVAAVGVGWMRRHIAEGAGVEGEFAPLKDMTRVKKRKRGGDRTEPAFRNGGKPLMDTGEMARSLGAKCARSDGGIRLTLTGLDRAAYHDRGFKTLGPNFIPLSKKGRRGHATGANPADEGLVPGWDFLMAWNGVTVPARPFVAPTRSDLDELAATLYLALKAQIER